MAVNLRFAPDEGSLERTLTEFGWAHLVAIYLWIKAARVWYWPVQWPRKMIAEYRQDEAGGRPSTP
ncbi:MAG TPA: hypothetical protein VN408_06895, partial [Actinoplanes sp.]|nr:hypothetical protein [Actinoplanes sp.]